MVESAHRDRLVLRRVVFWVAVLNLGYFFVEYAAASLISSVALFADSIDFLEDATINFLIVVAAGWSAARRRIVGFLLALILLLPGLAAAWTAWSKFGSPVVPEPVTLTLAACGALAVNITCTMMLARVRQHGGSLSSAAYLSARNDVLANIAIIGAGLMTFATHSHWPDLIVGIGIAVMNAGAAYEVYEAAEREADDLISGPGVTPEMAPEGPQKRARP